MDQNFKSMVAVEDEVLPSFGAHATNAGFVSSLEFSDLCFFSQLCLCASETHPVKLKGTSTRALRNSTI